MKTSKFPCDQWVQQTRAQRALSIAFGLILLAAPLRAQIVFQDNFDRADSSSLGPEWQLLTGTMLQVHNGWAEEVLPQQIEDSVIVPGLNKAQQTIDVDWEPIDGDSGVDGRLLGRVRDADNYYGARLGRGNPTEAVLLFKVVGGVYTELARSEVQRASTYPYHLRLTISGTSLEFRVDRPGATTLVINATDSSIDSGSAGLTGFAAWGGTQGRSTYDNFVVTSADVQPGVNWKSAWSSGTTYATGDAVSFNGSSFISLIQDNTGNPPDTSPASWDLMAQRGATGATGSVGPTGATGATGATGPTGARGLNWKGSWSSGVTYATGDAVRFSGSSYIGLMDNNVGNSPDTSPANWDLIAQQGDAGVAGPMGAAGPTGATGATGATGPTGPAGATGAPGANGTSGSAIGGNYPNTANNNFLLPWGATTSATEANANVPLPAGTARNLVVSLMVGPGTGQSATITIRKNGVSTALACSVSGTATTCSDPVNSVIFSAGDLLSILYNETVAAASRIRFSFQFNSP